MALGAQRLLPVLQLNYASWAKMLGGQEVSNEVLDLLDQPLPVYADAPPQTLMPFERSITLSDLTFQYEKNAPWAVAG